MGRTERIESASQLLYPRYTSLSDAVLVSEALAPASALVLLSEAQFVTPVQYPEGSVRPVSQPQPTAGVVAEHSLL